MQIEIFLKINSLHSSCCNELKKIQKSSTSRVSANSVCKPNLWHHNLFDFIAKQEVPTKRITFHNILFLITPLLFLSRNKLNMKEILHHLGPSSYEQDLQIICMEMIA
jgi:hypothetical protein